MSNFYNALNNHRAINRYRFLTILNAADQCQAYQFAKQATMLWLVNYPGDLYVKYYQARSFEKSGKVEQGKLEYQKLIELDPSFIEPMKALSELSSAKKQKLNYQGLTQYLLRADLSETNHDAWLRSLSDTRTKYEEGKLSEAIQGVHGVIIKDPPSPLPAILHLKIANEIQNQEMLNNLSDIYYEKWPSCLQINIIKAIAEIEQGKETAAVERLHWVESQDNAGQVINKLLGRDHRFKDMWPEQMEAFFDLPIPASVSSYLGWNQLNSGRVNRPEFKQNPTGIPAPQKDKSGQTQRINVGNHAQEQSYYRKPVASSTTPKSKREKSVINQELEDIQQAFSKIAKRFKKLDLERKDNRFPVYVILASRKQLETVYGPNTADVIDNLLKELIGYIQRLPDWDGKIFYPDDSALMTRLGLKPILANDAWQVKLALSDLDRHLEKQGEMIGALLIVGGPEIIPYHHLPNPTNDNDLDVPSDNPYGTIDENYFIPQWPVGRLPGETGSDAGLLLSQIRALIYQYQQKLKKSKSIGFNFAAIFSWIFQLLSNLRRNTENKDSLGYSAEIWKDASSEVYKSTGPGKDLQLSPPIHSGTLALNNGQGHTIGYFNLHGIKEGPNWYGQKDFSSSSLGPDYPIALSPDMFNEKNHSPKLVFSEACYGANVIDKKYKEAISLKFMDTGTRSFVGSTCIAYGSVMPPLIAADYLAESFWRLVLEGQPAGYALMQAKLNLVEEMTQTQGFLDGEDQKTILSFVLFGDPLAVSDGIKSMPKPLSREKFHTAIKTISDSDMIPEVDNRDLPGNVSQQVKKIVESYLPGLQNAQMKFNKSYEVNLDQKTRKSRNPQRVVVTLEKSFDFNHNAAHHHFARMTFNEKGKLVKFTTSR